MQWLNTKTDQPGKGTFAAVFDGTPGKLIVDSYGAQFTSGKETIPVTLEELQPFSIFWLKIEPEKIKIGDKVCIEITPGHPVKIINL